MFGAWAFELARRRQSSRLTRYVAFYCRHITCAQVCCIHTVIKLFLRGKLTAGVSGILFCWVVCTFVNISRSAQNVLKFAHFIYFRIRTFHLNTNRRMCFVDFFSGIICLLHRRSQSLFHLFLCTKNKTLTTVPKYI